MNKNEIENQHDRVMRYARLIEKQTGRAIRPYRADGYVNAINKYGTTKDTSEHYEFHAEPAVPDETLSVFYEGNGLFAKIIDTPAEEALKHGFTLEDITDQETENFYREAYDELDGDEVMITGIKWARLFGGAIAVMLINDGRGINEPLDWQNIRSIDDIRIYDRSLIQPDYSSMFAYDPSDPFRTRGSRLGMPEYYYVFSKYGSFTVHESRCLIFQNGILPENCSNTVYQLWGMPEYIRIKRAIRDAELAHGSGPKMLDKSVQAIYKMKNLADILSTSEGEDVVIKRLQAIDLARGLLNSITIDSEGEDYDFKQFQFSGVSEIIDKTCSYLSSLTSIPPTVLFGQGVSGLSSTDDTSMETWYNYVERIQKRMVKSNLRYLMSIVFQAGLSTGEIKEMPPVKVKFNPLWSMSETEQIDIEQKKAQVQSTKAQTANTYVAMGAIDPSEVRKKLAESEEFDVENLLDDFPEEDLAAALENQGVDMNAVSNGAGEINSSESAPEATKLPQDMNPNPNAQGENTEANKDTDDTDKHTPTSRNYGGVGVLVVEDGKILAGTRHNDTGYGLICGPGGHIEKGETPEQAAFRETEEEFGITPKELILLGDGPTEPDSGITPQIFLCLDYEGKPQCLDLEMTNPKFYTPEELELLTPSLFQPFADGLKILFDVLDKENDDSGSVENNPSTFSNISENPIDKSAEKVIIKSQEITETNGDGGPGSGNHGHEGVPGQIGGSAPSGTENVATKFKTTGTSMEISSDLSLKYGKKGKQTAKIKQGKKIEGIYSFAGKGSENNLVVSGTLSRQFGGDPKDWSHKCGFAPIVCPNGEEIEGAEIHWFEHDDIGQIKFKVKYKEEGDN